MKKDKLYTVNKWNRPLFAQGVDRGNNNIFDDGGNSNTEESNNTGVSNNVGPLSSTGTSYSSGTPNYYNNSIPDYNYNFFSNSPKDVGPISPYSPEYNYPVTRYSQDLGRGNVLQGIGLNPLNPFVNTAVQAGLAAWQKNNSIKGQAASTNPTTPKWQQAAGAAAGLLGGIAGKAISGGYSTGGIGEGVAGIGNAAGDILMASGVAAPIGLGVKFLSGIAGGAINRGWGVKRNNKNIASIKANTGDIRTSGNQLASATTNEAFMDAAANMGSASGFKSGDLVKGGWFSEGKAAREANRYLNAEKQALAMQTHAMAQGAKNVDKIQDDNVMANFAAMGGSLNDIEQYANGGYMGALEYGLLSDYNNRKLLEAQARNKIPSNPFGALAVNPFNGYADGGEIEIKHPGRLTELKKRTGKTEAELYNDGNPNHKQMVVFARNARKWQKAYGGFLDAADNLFALGGFTNMPAQLNNTSYKETPTNIEEDTDKTNLTKEDYSNAGIYKDKKGFYIDDGQGGKRYISKKQADYAARVRREEIRSGGAKDRLGGAINPEAPQEMLNPNNSYAIGGDVQMHGGDYTTGSTHIDEGGTHEENPNQGVQVGVDPEGTPNLVEEGEVIYNDYVYSQRIELDDEAKEKFHFSKKQDITYADAAKKLEKEISERPNDPLSKAAFKSQMQDLAEEQERQKAEMQAEEARKQFESLSPEEQVAIMQNAQAQEQQAAEEQAIMQEQAAQEQAMQEQAAMQGQPTEEQMMQEQMMAQQQGMPSQAEAAAIQQQILQGDGSAANLGPQPQMAAYGGNLYGNGGIIKLLKLLGYEDTAQAAKAGWKPKDFGNYETWEDIKADSELSDGFKWTDEFSKRITSPVQKAVLALGWNPLAKKLETTWYENPSKNAVGWTESVGKKKLNKEEFDKYAERYPNTLGWAIKNKIIKAPEEGSTIPMEKIAEAMSEAPDWKATNEWLYSDIANQAKYLGMARGLNPNDDTKFEKRWSPYGSFKQDNDGNWTYELNPDLDDAQKKAFTDLFRNTRTDNKIGVMYNSRHIPKESVSRYIIDENGQPKLITEDNLDKYQELGKYTWGDEPNDTNNTAIFYSPKAPGTAIDAAANSPEAAAAQKVLEQEAEGKGNIPIVDYKHKYFGLGDLGPIIGLGLQAVGFGKPDSSAANAAIDVLARRGAAVASHMPIGNRIKYKPMDIWAQQNRNDANSNAVNRALLNNASPVGTRNTGLIANSYAHQIGAGELYKNALQYNDNLAQQVAAFNRDTDKFNAEAFNRMSLTNAELLNRYRQQLGAMRLQQALNDQESRASWYRGIYKNIDNLAAGLGAHDRQNTQGDMIAGMINTGILGNVGEDTPLIEGTGFRIRRRDMDRDMAAEGGKINRKKRKGGLTF